jgi:hypothetical protein
MRGGASERFPFSTARRTPSNKLNLPLATHSAGAGAPETSAYLLRKARTHVNILCDAGYGNQMECVTMKRVAWTAALLLALTAFILPGASLAQGVQPQNTVQPSGTPTGTAVACQTFTLNRGWDTWISSLAPTANFGRDVKLTTDGDPASSALLRWDLTGVPAGTRIAHAFLRVRHMDPADQSETIFQIYALRRAWSDMEANWEYASRTTRWTMPGAADQILDRESTPMGETPITVRSPATVRIDLDEEGVNQINRWLSGVEPNYGLVIQDFRSGDGFRFASFESRFPPELALSTCPQPWSAEERVALATATPTPATTASPTALVRSGTASAPSALATPGALVTRAPQATAITTATPLPALAAGSQSLSFQDGAAPDSRYTGTLDTYVSQSVPGGNFGTARVAWLAGGGPTGRGPAIASVVYWNLTAIPRGSQVISVTITLNTVVASAGDYSVYEAMRPWDERTLTWAAAREGSWLAPNATGWTEDNALALGTYRPAAPGPTVIELDERGVALAQRWVDDPRMNFGLVIANTRAMGFASFETSEALTIANRPKLTITYR